MLTLGSLFDGIGGWQLAAVHAGVKPIWSSEIEKFPLAVTRKRFPDTKQLGDVTKITDVEPVDIVCAGSPCQDLSIAGKREGLAGERSGLFINAINIVRQMRMSTGWRQPRFFIWENVPGAFTSGSERGADFRAVLESIAETDIPMPKDGRWANAGMVQCPKCEIAWRVLDAQYWGVPQRRKRIFLVADFAAAERRAAEVLFVEPCVPRDSAESERAREEIAGGTGKSIGSAGETLTPWDVQSNRIQSVNGKPGQGYPCVACYDISHRQDVIRPQEKGTLPCLTARAGTGGNNLPVVHSYCIAGNTIDRQPQNGGKGTHNGAIFDTRQVAYSFDSKASNSMKSANPYSGCRQVEIAKCLDTTVPEPSKNQGGIAIACKPKEVEYAITAKHYKNRNAALRDRERINAMREKTVGASVRRLTPLEAERLQGLPDGYTDVPLNGKPASDANRYKALGNGMAQPCADYVIQRIVDEVGKT